jgi:CheY-like chemotaxis protein
LPSSLNNLRVFVVEDEALVAMNLEMILEDLGCQVVGPALRFDKAQAMVGDGLKADAAILDVNVAGREVFPLAEQLSELGIPMVFATGYDQTGFPEKWSSSPAVRKPYTLEDVEKALKQAIELRAAQN